MTTPDTTSSGSPTRPGLGLYVHLPLCPSRCPYCDFFAQPYTPNKAGLIKDGIRGHLPLLAPRAAGRSLDTVYVGGGDPGMWPARFIAEILAGLDEQIGLAPGAEVSLEANPGSLSPARLKALRAAGVNRLSLGVQSFQPAMLSRLGRRHTPGQVGRVVAWARQAGFDNLNLDLIYGLPGQDPAGCLADVAAALELGPDHVSFYELTLSPDTPFGRKYAKGQPPLPEDEAILAMETGARQMLEQAGLARYEVSNFARPGFTCAHNQSTWQGGEYLALGPGACGHLAGRRWGLLADGQAYLAEVEAGREPFGFEEALSPEQRALELLMLGLRTLEGVDLAAVGRVLDRDPLSAYADALEQIQKSGWARLEAGCLRPTPKGLDMADAAAALFVE